ncbi:MAG: zinc-ribbon domain-containing protein [Gemmatimonadales bacterium]
MSDATFPCPVCGASLPARAKFCAECGSAVKAPAASAPARAATPGAAAAANQILPWFIAGVSVIAIQTLALILALRPPSGQVTGTENSAVQAQGGGGFNPTARATTDISSLTPRQSADRLYDRVARASEANDSQQVQFFGPMAIQAYAAVTPLDIDAHLHLGMVDIALGNVDGASAEADTIVRTSRTHLFGPLLKARVAQLKGNTAALQQAYRTFLANYDAERRKNLPEYEQHATILTELKTTAESARGR